MSYVYNAIMNPTTTLLLEGPAGKLETIIAPPSSSSREACAIICHPHSLHGGTMHNKVVTTLSRTFQQLGLTTVRFNFRGVGKSEGVYDEGRGEGEDLLAVMAWVKKEYPHHAIWLAGFSFGAYVAATIAAKTPPAQLITIAPPVEHFTLQTLPPIICPWIVVQGELDEVVPPDKVFAWIESRDPKPVVLRFPEAGHFFHGQLAELRDRLVIYFSYSLK